MKFYTNRISTGKPVNFGDFVTKLANSNASLNKTAAAETITKEANLANLGDKKAPAFGKKDEKKEKKDGKEKAACGTECESAAESEVKVAGSDCKPDKDGEVHVEMQEMDPVGGTNTGKPEGEKKKESEAKAEVKEAGKKATVPTKAPAKVPAKTAPGKSAPAKKASNDDVPEENKGVTHQTDKCCGAPTSKGDDGSEGEKSGGEEKRASKEAKVETSVKKEASSPNFVRIANLDAKTKADWKNYWKKLYPSEYVNALFADK